jgi:ABC-type molybdate transport system substrate-binding protein
MKPLLLLCFWVLTLTSASAAELTVYAAASLMDVMRELASLMKSKLATN